MSEDFRILKRRNGNIRKEFPNGGLRQWRRLAAICGGIRLKKVLVLNGHPVEYELEYKNVKRINLRVHRDGRVCVSAGSYVPQRYIDAFLIQNADFILETLDKFRTMREAGDGMAAGRNREYRDGDILYLKGESYRLRVLEGKKEKVEPVGRDLLVTQKDVENAERRKRMMDKFLTGVCRENVEELCRRVYPSFEKLGVSWPEIRIRNMVSRWGSCQPSRGVLTFARQLIEVPESCAEYVVVHEFSHFIHPDHSPRFHDFMDGMMPDWKNRKVLLNSRAWVGAPDGREEKDVRTGS